MSYYLFQCRSLTYAQRAAFALGRKGISAYLLRTPKRIAGEGCSYCIKISSRNSDYAMDILRGIGLTPIHVYKAEGGGTYQEVIF